MAVKPLVSMRLSEDIVSELDSLCLISNRKRSEVVSALIHGDYDRLNGNPELRSLLSRLQALSEDLESYGIGSASSKGT